MNLMVKPLTDTVGAVASARNRASGGHADPGDIVHRGEAVLKDGKNKPGFFKPGFISRIADGYRKNMRNAAETEKLPGYYTGPGGKYEPAGIVDENSFVVPKEGVDQSTGLPKAEYMKNIEKHFPKDWKEFSGGLSYEEYTKTLPPKKEFTFQFSASKRQPKKELSTRDKLDQMKRWA
jgi:hypothetical protein